MLDVLAFGLWGGFLLAPTHVVMPRWFPWAAWGVILGVLAYWGWREILAEIDKRLAGARPTAPQPEPVTVANPSRRRDPDRGVVYPHPMRVQSRCEGKNESTVTLAVQGIDQPSNETTMPLELVESTTPVARTTVAAPRPPKDTDVPPLAELGLDDPRRLFDRDVRRTPEYQAGRRQGFDDAERIRREMSIDNPPELGPEEDRP
jgi:hypothetical protein